LRLIFFDIICILPHKIRIVNSARLSEFIDDEEKQLDGKGRIMIHVSGTEPCIRIMVETNDEILSTDIAERIAGVIKEINLENLKCAE
jgi:phosphoglucosamine mutase